MLVDFGSLSGSHNTEGFLFSNRFPLGLELFFLQKQRFRLPTDKSASIRDCSFGAETSNESVEDLIS